MTWLNSSRPCNAPYPEWPCVQSLAAKLEDVITQRNKYLFTVLRHASLRSAYKIAATGVCTHTETREPAKILMSNFREIHEPFKFWSISNTYGHNAWKAAKHAFMFTLPAWTDLHVDQRGKQKKVLIAFTLDGENKIFLLFFKYWMHAFCPLCENCRLVLFLGAFAKLRKATISFIMPLLSPVSLSAWNNSAPSRRIFIKFDIWEFF